MLEEMNKGGAAPGSNKKQVQRFDTWGKDKHINLDVVGNKQEESVDALIAKLNQKGAKVKLISDEDDVSKKTSTPIKTPSKKQQQVDKENIKDPAAAPGVDIEKLREIEEAHEQQKEMVLQKQQQNEQLQNELQDREQALYIERKQKEDLQRLIEQMEQKLVKGGHGMEGVAAEEQEQLRKERQLQKQLKK